MDFLRYLRTFLPTQSYQNWSVVAEADKLSSWWEKWYCQHTQNIFTYLNFCEVELQFIMNICMLHIALFRKYISLGGGEPKVYEALRS